MSTLTNMQLCRLAELIAEFKTLLGDTTEAKDVSIIDIADLARGFGYTPTLKLVPMAPEPFRHCALCKTASFCEGQRECVLTARLP